MLKHDLKKPCKECPYVGNLPGWIGDHDSPQDFVDLAKADRPFPCHQTVEWTPCYYGEVTGGWSCEKEGCNGITHIANQPQQCAGQLMFMKLDLQRPRNKERARHYDRLKQSAQGVKILYPGEKLVQHHEKGISGSGGSDD